MSNIVQTQVDPDYVFISGKIESDETLSAEVAGTAGTVTDTTSYPVADQDGNTEKVTIDSGTEQTVTYSGAHTTAAQIAASQNAQLKGCSVAVVGGQVKITSDSTGVSSSVAIGTGTAALTWAAAVAGTGYPDGVTITPGMLLARTTVTSAPYTAGDIVAYNSANSPTGSNAIKGVADFTKTISASGSVSAKMAVAGKAWKDKIIKQDGTAVTAVELDQLVANTSIVAVNVTDCNDYQNA